MLLMLAKLKISIRKLEISPSVILNIHNNNVLICRKPEIHNVIDGSTLYNRRKHLENRD